MMKIITEINPNREMNENWGIRQWTGHWSAYVRPKMIWTTKTKIYSRSLIEWWFEWESLRIRVYLFLSVIEKLVSSRSSREQLFLRLLECFLRFSVIFLSSLGKIFRINRRETCRSITFSILWNAIGRMSSEKYR